MKVQTYLFFEGRCEEAIEFYKATLGAQVLMLMRYKDSPDQSNTPPGGADKVMHASLQIGETVLMASDGGCSGKSSFGGFSLSTYGRDKADAQRLFDALSAGGQVQMPLTETFFSPAFGMLTDKFGVGWMVLVDQPR
jgi:PhnB protein